jgi:uncharacterized protein (DUF305 family)
MNKPASAVRTAALLSVLAVGACAAGGTTAPAASTSPSPSSRTAPRAVPAAVEFVSGMIHHHAQAVLMAGWAPTHDAGPLVRTLCQRIVISQRDEIGLMQTWLGDHGAPVPEPDPRGMRMTMGGAEHMMLMPGMLTDEQLAELDRARGADFDRLFVTYMIQHHQGAITMVEQLFASAGGTADDFMYKLASDIYADQTAEIDRMQQLLDRMPGADAR